MTTVPPAPVTAPVAAPETVVEDSYRVFANTLTVRLRRPANRIAFRVERISANAYRVRTTLIGRTAKSKWLGKDARLPADWRTIEVVEGQGPNAPTRLLAARK